MIIFGYFQYNDKYVIKDDRFTNADIHYGCYWGDTTSKKSGTPDDWVLVNSGTRSSQWCERKTAPKLIWTKDEIFYSGKKLLSINDFPNEIEVAKDVYFGSPVAFTGAELNPLKNKIALSITGGVHEFGWLYDLKNEKLVPIAFSFDGGVSLVRWKSDHEIVFNITSPKPATTEIVIDINKLPEYPRLKSVTGASIREEMGEMGCPEMMIINKMPGPGAPKEPYYIDNGERVEVSDYDPIWLKANCDVPVQEVY